MEPRSLQERKHGKFAEAGRLRPNLPGKFFKVREFLPSKGPLDFSKSFGFNNWKMA